MGNVATKERSRSDSASSIFLGSSAGSSRRGSVISNGLSSRRNRNNSSSSSASALGPNSGNGKSKGKGKHKHKESVQHLVLDPSEMVDGGYLQPQGVYSGPHDFKYKVVRQLIIDRRLAPFYKGLPDFDENWTDRQLLAAVRGLPLPPADRAGSVASPVTETESLSRQDILGNVQVVENELDKLNFSNDSQPEFISIPHNKPALSLVFGEQNGVWCGELNSPNSASNSPTPGSENIMPSSAPALTKLNSFASNITLPDSTDSLSPPLSSSPAIPFPTIHRDSSQEIIDSKSPVIPETNSTDLSHSPLADYHSLAQLFPNQKSDVPIEKTSGVDVPFTGVPGMSSAASIQLQAQYVRSRANTSSRYGPSSLPNRAPPETLLYRDALECPICFLFYPKLINLTRCCAQPICTECFVQIKRQSPHPPHEEEDSNGPSSESAPESAELISEPACCPYCMVPDLGVTFVPPQYRTGIGANGKRHNSLSPLAFLNSSSLSLSSKSSMSQIGNPANSSEYSVAVISESPSSVSLANPAQKRRGSLPASAPEVVTTDQIRPDWNIKLISARARAARQSAAATALHASAFLGEDMPASGSSSQRSQDRSSRFKTSRFGRLTSSSQSSSRSKPSSAPLPVMTSTSQPSPLTDSSSALEHSQPSSNSSDTTKAQFVSEGSSRRSPPKSMIDPVGTRLQALEDVMILEAIKLSIQEEELRKLKSKPIEDSRSPTESSNTNQL